MRWLWSVIVVVVVVVAGCHKEGPGAPGDDLARGGTDGAIVEGDGAVGGDGGDHDLKQADPCAALDCGAHGSCVLGATARCECTLGYVGDACDACDATGGFVPDGSGGCVKDPCVPNPCTPNRPVCVDQSGAAICNCVAGQHLDPTGDVCVDDTTCLPTTCSGHGTCGDATGSVVCTCGPGYLGTFCAACDLGYHPDGAGGCTSDPCTPNPCTASHQTACNGGSGSAICSCDAGYHLVGLDCVIDQVCETQSCSQHGACSVTGGVRSCACDEGYASPTCAGCADGWHVDGTGGCTQDPCLPNPCTQPNQTVCSSNGTGAAASCGCDAGFHADGVGGCTSDPCTPNLCAMTNQACRVTTDGKAECYTPPCDDQNPCTVDTIVDGLCQNVARDEGAVCSTTLCLIGQTCGSGTCQGGTPRVCDDSNPCTNNQCDPVLGCQYEKSDALVPDDGKDCTIDKCANGVQSHAVNHDVCADDLYCNGTESCEPASPLADARGCVHKNAPAPPPLGANVCSHYECDEATDSFTLNKAPAGTTCNDNLPCTTGDQCRSDGACRGSLVGSCNLQCATAGTPGALSGIDFQSARLQGAVTLNGASLPTSTGGSNVGLYLVSRETGARQLLHSVDFQYQGGNPYTVGASDLTYASTVMPGVYDLLYARGISSWDPTPTVYYSYPTDNYADGYRFLQRDLVVGPGVNVLDVDLPSAKLQGAVKLNGVTDLPTSTGGSNIGLYLVDRDTGSRQLIHSVDFQYQGGNPYTVAASDASYATTVLPGTYDLLYARGISSWDPTPTVYYSYPTDNYADGYRYLMKGVVVTAGSNQLDVDLPSAKLHGDLTLNGGDLPTSTGGSNIGLYLVDRDTGSRQLIHSVDFQYQGGNPYTVAASDKSYSTTILPGTYDLLYARGISSWDPTPTVYYSYATDNYADGYRYLKKGLVIGAGDTELDIDLPSAKINGTILLNGMPDLPTSTGGSNIGLYLVDRDTGSRQLLHSVDFQYQGGNPYTVAASVKLYASTVLPGTYDLLYARGISSWDPTPTVYYSYETDNYADGYRYLQKNLVIPPGTTTLDLDLPSAKLAGTIKLNGADLPTSTGGSNIGLYLVDRDTGARQLIHSVDFQYQGGNPYTVAASDKKYATTVLPGTYDLLYARGISSWDPTPTVYYTYPSDNYADGYRYLVKNVTIVAGNNVLDVDLPSTKIAGAVTLNGQALPTSTGGSNIGLYLVDEETRARTLIHSVDFQYQGGNPYTVSPSDSLYGATVLPGTYRLLYARGISSWDPTPTVYYSYPTDNYADAYRYLGACYATP